MYSETINKIIAAINAGHSGFAQMLLSNLLLRNGWELNENARDALVAAIPGSEVVFYGTDGVGLRAGYLLVDGERYYFA